MLQTIENAFLKCTVDSFGGELRSVVLKESGENYLWCADKSVWGKVSPNLFPAIGIVAKEGYSYNGKFFPMSRHGFARDNEFEVENAEAEELTLLLKSCEAIKKLYPYDFELRIRYTLCGSSVRTSFEVKNLSGETMYFQLGGHTAFSTELGGSKMEDYRLEFDREVDLHAKRPAGVKEDGLENIGKVRSIKLSSRLFDSDAMMFENIQSHSVRLSRKGGKTVRFEYPEFSSLAIWAAAGTDRYVCIEPWTTMPDEPNFDGEITKKKGIVSLSPNEERSYSYTITVE